MKKFFVAMMFVLMATAAVAQSVHEHPTVKFAYAVEVVDAVLDVAAPPPMLPKPFESLAASDAIALYDNVVACEAAASPLWIHNQSQKVCYVDESEYPFIEGQFHWSPADFPLFSRVTFTIPPSLGHTHLGCWWPYRAEMKTPAFRVNCRAVLFHTAGVIQRVHGKWVRDVIWAATGTSTPPSLVGDPNGVKEFFLSFVVDLEMATARNENFDPFVEHGWAFPAINIDTSYDNGDWLRGTFIPPVWSTYDTSKPLSIVGAELSDGGISVQSWGSSARDEKPDTMGVSVVSIPEALPILGPLTAPVVVTSHTYNYTDFSPNLPLGVFDLRKNPDYHHGDGGVLLESALGPAGPGTLNHSLLTPEMFRPTGDKLAFFWTTMTGDGGTLFTGQKFTANEQISAILVVNVFGNGDGTSAPPPPPPPPPVDPGPQVFTPMFKKDAKTGALLICESSTVCKELLVR